jgi:hypothetical protein
VRKGARIWIILVDLLEQGHESENAEILEYWEASAWPNGEEAGSVYRMNNIFCAHLVRSGRPQSAVLREVWLEMEPGRNRRDGPHMQRQASAPRSSATRQKTTHAANRPRTERRWQGTASDKRRTARALQNAPRPHTRRTGDGALPRGRS